MLNPDIISRTMNHAVLNMYITAAKSKQEAAKHCERVMQEKLDLFEEFPNAPKSGVPALIKSTIKWLEEEGRVIVHSEKNWIEKVVKLMETERESVESKVSKKTLEGTSTRFKIAVQSASRVIGTTVGIKLFIGDSFLLGITHDVLEDGDKFKTFDSETGIDTFLDIKYEEVEEERKAYDS